MICAKCANPRERGGRPPAKARQPKQIALVKIGELFDCERFQCPRCKGIFIFPKLVLKPDYNQIPLFA